VRDIPPYHQPKVSFHPLRITVLDRELLHTFRGCRDVHILRWDCQSDRGLSRLVSWNLQSPLPVLSLGNEKTSHTNIGPEPFKLGNQIHRSLIRFRRWTWRLRTGTTSRNISPSSLDVIVRDKTAICSLIPDGIPKDIGPFGLACQCHVVPSWITSNNAVGCAGAGATVYAVGSEDGVAGNADSQRRDGSDGESCELHGYFVCLFLCWDGRAVADLG